MNNYSIHFIVEDKPLKSQPGEYNAGVFYYPKATIDRNPTVQRIIASRLPEVSLEKNSPYQTKDGWVPLWIQYSPSDPSAPSAIAHELGHLLHGNRLKMYKFQTASVPDKVKLSWRIIRSELMGWRIGKALIRKQYHEMLEKQAGYSLFSYAMGCYTKGYKMQPKAMTYFAKKRLHVIPFVDKEIRRLWKELYLLLPEDIRKYFKSRI